MVGKWTKNLYSDSYTERNLEVIRPQRLVFCPAPSVPSTTLLTYSPLSPLSEKEVPLKSYSASSLVCLLTGAEKDICSIQWDKNGVCLLEVTAPELPASSELYQAAQGLRIKVYTARKQSQMKATEPHSQHKLTQEIPLPPALDLIPSDLFRSFSPYQFPCSSAMFDHVTLLLRALQRLSLLLIIKSQILPVVSRALQGLDSCCLPASSQPAGCTCSQLHSCPHPSPSGSSLGGAHYPCP